MTDRSQTTDDHSQDTTADGFRRREFVALGAGATATMLAGCAGDGGLTPSDGSGSSDGSDGSDGSETLTGNFRLLISDAPADIGDFDELNVTLDEARIFEANEDGDEEEDDDGEETDEGDDTEEDEDDGSDQGGNETDDESDPANGTAEEDDDADEDPDDGGDEEADDDEDEADDDEDDEDDGSDDESDRGFTVVALDGATVDLTQVIEDDAIAVFDGEIPAGSYEKVELSVTEVEGIVDGEVVDVKLPSEKLQITNGFEVTPDEAVSFVFDINVVKRGKNNGYILKPVISGSGVAGRDVEVNEIDEDDDDEEEDDGGDEDDDGSDDRGDEDDDGSDDTDDGDDADDGDDTDDGSTTGGNQTDDGSSDAENGTATNELES